MLDMNGLLCAIFSASSRLPALTIVKPVMDSGPNGMHWVDLPQVHTAQLTLAPGIEGAIAEVA